MRSRTGDASVASRTRIPHWTALRALGSSTMKVDTPKLRSAPPSSTATFSRTPATNSVTRSAILRPREAMLSKLSTSAARMAAALVSSAMGQHSS